MAVHPSKFKLFVSPVVPALAAHVGVLVDPSFTASFTVIEEPALNVAEEPPPSPTMLNSAPCQAVARSTTLSFPDVV